MKSQLGGTKSQLWVGDFVHNREFSRSFAHDLGPGSLDCIIWIYSVNFECDRDHPPWGEIWFHRAGISSGGAWSVATCTDKPIQPIGRDGRSFFPFCVSKDLFLPELLKYGYQILFRPGSWGLNNQILKLDLSFTKKRWVCFVVYHSTQFWALFMVLWLYGQIWEGLGPPPCEHYVGYCPHLRRNHSPGRGHPPPYR